MPEFREVDPRTLHLPPSRAQGADPAKLQRQIALFGRSSTGMPPPWVYEGSDGALVLYNGVTRATRIAKLTLGTLLRVEVIGKLPKPFAAEAICRRTDHRRPPAMTDLQREAIAVLAEIWILSPDVRLGQLMAHLGLLGEIHVERGLGEIDDDQLLAILYRHRAELLARSPNTSTPCLPPTSATTSVSGSPAVP